MFLRKPVRVAASLLLACAAASAQEGRKPPVPDLSGRWVTDMDSSHHLESKDRGHLFTPRRLMIEHREPEIKMTRTFVLKTQESTAKLVYYTDGRGEKNPTLIADGGTGESKTSWEGRRLRIRGKHRIRVMGSSIDQDFAEEWELSADGKTLEQVVTYNKSTVFPDMRIIFKRVE